MKISKTLLCLSCAGALIAAPQVVAQQQRSTLQEDRQVIVPARPSWENTPTDESTTQPVTPNEKALRQSRSDAFNNTLGLAPRLEDQAKAGGGVGMAIDRGYIPPLPVDSPSIVVASVISAESHLSADHTAIYTELKLQIEQVLKDDTGTLAPSASADVLERGGTVTLNGETLHYPISTSSGPIDLGKRYLLFLYAKPAALKAFGVTRAWLLEQNHPLPTRAYRAGTADVAPYMAMNESEFTSYVQHAIRTHSTR